MVILKKMILLINTLGCLLIGFNVSGQLNSNLLPVKVNSKWKYLQENGLLIELDTVQELGCFNNGLAYFKKHNLYGYLDTTLKTIIKPTYHYGSNFYNQYAQIEDCKKRIGIIDHSGRFIMKPTYTSGDFYNNDVLIIYKDSLWNMVDYSGKVVYSQKEYIEYLNEGLFKAIKLDKYYFIDNKGSSINNSEYEDITKFSEGLCGIKLNDKYGFINKENRLIIKPQYDWVSNFTCGLSVVMQKDKNGISSFYGIINLSGDVVLPIKYERLSIVNSQTISYYNNFNGLWGLMKLNGEIITSAIYQDILSLNGNVLFVLKDNKNSIINIQGSILHDFNSIVYIDKINSKILAFYTDRHYLFYEKKTNVKMGYYDFVNNKVVWQPTN